MKLPPLVKALFAECEYLKDWESFSEEQMLQAKQHAEASRAFAIPASLWSKPGRLAYEKKAKLAFNAQWAYEKAVTYCKHNV